MTNKIQPCVLYHVSINKSSIIVVLLERISEVLLYWCCLTTKLIHQQLVQFFQLVKILTQILVNLVASLYMDGRVSENM